MFASGDFKRGLARGLGFGCGLLLLGSMAALFAQSLNSFNAGDLISASQLNTNFATLNAEISEAVPDGAIMAFALTSCPTGWIAADGTSGTPDSRGQFLRGINDFASAAGTRSDGSQDPDGLHAVGAFQGDQLRSHNHQHKMVDHGFGDIGLGTNARGLDTGPHRWYTTNNPGGNETRPKNVGVLYCVRSNL